MPLGHWQVSITEGPAGPFHQHVPPAETAPQIWVRRIPRPAIVLGSSQPDALIRHDRAERDGLEVCRRRSGGGLVYIDPETDCWIDVIVPRTSTHWDADVGRAFHWLGDRWAELLADPTIGGGLQPMVHRTSRPSPLGRLWCFADLGHGEVSLAGSKVVGLSQRRTRTWARLQCLAIGAWPGSLLRRYVDLDLLRQQPSAIAGQGPADGHHERTAGDALTVDDVDPTNIVAGPPPDLRLPDPVALAERFVAALPPP